MLGAPNASSRPLTEDHWRVLVSSVSTTDNAAPYLVRPTATMRWVGLVTAADHARAVGIGGRSSSHFISDDELIVKQRRVSVAVSPRWPPIVVSWLLTTVMLKSLLTLS